MKYGINLLLWTDSMHDGLIPTVEAIKKMGYDGVEMPLFDPNKQLYEEWGKKLDDIGLERTAVTIRGAEDNPISPSASVRSAAVDAMKKTIDCCHASGVKLLAGPTHSALGEFSGCGPTNDEIKWGRRNNAAGCRVCLHCRRHDCR
jgi:D-psicose/D-tagatose/L-ribulose 3-epimerase